MTDEQQKEIFSKNLIYYMELYDKNQREVAKAINVSPQTFNTWIVKKALPRMGKVQLLAEYFHINKSDLIEERKKNVTTSVNLDPDADELISDYKKLDDTDRIIIKSTVNTLLNADKYKKDTESSSA